VSVTRNAGLATNHLLSLIATDLEDRIPDFEQLPSLLWVLCERLSDINLYERLPHVTEPDGKDFLDSTFRFFRVFVLEVMKRVDRFSEQTKRSRLHCRCSLFDVSIVFASRCARLTSGLFNSAINTGAISLRKPINCSSGKSCWQNSFNTSRAPCIAPSS
jgi:hypothetical protein